MPLAASRCFPERRFLRSPTDCERLPRFRERDLSEIEVQYLFVDAVYESLRPTVRRKVSSCAPGPLLPKGGRFCFTWQWATRSRKAVGRSSSEDMIGRGLRTPTSVTSDGAPGLINAIEQLFSGSLRIRCWYHKLSNISSKIRGSRPGVHGPRPGRKRRSHPPGRRSCDGFGDRAVLGHLPGGGEMFC